MSQIVGIVGPSGNGKSRSIVNMDYTETCIINADKKPLSFVGAHNYSIANKNYIETSDIPTIRQMVQKIHDTRPDITSIVIDTINTIMNDKEMSASFMAQSSGADARSKWSEMASDIYNLNNMIKGLSRKDLVVYEMFHEGLRTVKIPGEDEVDYRCILTNGRKLEKIQLESGMTTVLFTKVVREKGKNIYKFETQSNYSTGKSPEGMFTDLLIDNDLKFVDDKIRDYYYLRTPVQAVPPGTVI